MLWKIETVWNDEVSKQIVMAICVNIAGQAQKFLTQILHMQNQNKKS